MVTRLAFTAGLVAAMFVAAGCTSEGSVPSPAPGTTASTSSTVLVDVAPGDSALDNAQLERLESEIRTMPAVSRLTYLGPTTQHPGGQLQVVFTAGADVQSATEKVRQLAGVAGISVPTAMPS